MASFELTETGLQTPRIPEARELVVQEYKAQFEGDDTQTDNNSPDGLLIDTMTILLSLLWEANAQVYNSAFFRTSRGTSLDLVLDLFGKMRRAASPSTAFGVWWGDPSTAIPFGTLAAVQVTGSQFSTSFAATTEADIDAATQWMVLVEDAIVGDTYTITIDATAYDYVVQPTDGILELIQGLQAAVNAGGDALAVVLEDEGVGYVYVTSDPLSTLRDLDVSTSGAGTISRFLAIRVASTSTEDGEVLAAAGSLQDIVNPIAGIEGLINMEDATVGRLQETDAEFRLRHLDNLNSGGCATPDAIRSDVLDVPTVEQARVFENVSFVPDITGRPPKSFEVVVVSLDGSADDDEIGQAIWDCKAAGIEAFGSTTVTAFDSEGNPRSVSFSRAERLFTWVRVTVTPGEGFPTDGDPEASIRNAILEHFGRGGDAELTMGRDFYRFQSHEPINEAVRGIANAVVETDVTINPAGPPTYAPNDVVASDFQLIDLDSSRIEVVIL